MEAGKRLFDIIFSFLGLVVLSPMLLVIAAAVKLQDGGPVFFRQERAGRDFKPFQMLKFRTMTPDAPSKGPAITAGGDRRVTRVGRLLRKSKLDELPQLLNVLKGDMSLVGPRPEVFKYVHEFEDDFREVLSVRPGITDYASIMYRDEEGVLGASDDPERLYVTHVLPEKLSLNRTYVKNNNVGKDLRIIFSTFFALFASGPAPVLKECVATGRAVDVSPVKPVRKPLLPASAVKRLRGVIIFMFHFLVVTFSQLLVFEMMFNGEVPDRYLRILPYITGLALIVRLPLFNVFGLYRGMLRYSGVDDLIKIIASVTTGSFVIFGASIAGLFGKGYPVSAVVLDWLMTIGMICAFRLALRMYGEYQMAREGGVRAGNGKPRARRVLIVGAGDAGEMIVRDMLKRRGDYEPVGFVDDDETKKGLSMHGVTVMGTTKDLPWVVRRARPEEVLVAVPSAKPAMLHALMNSLSEHRLPITTLPNMREVLNGNVSVSQIRRLELEDLLTRPPVKVDMRKLGRLIKGKTVMVTGAGGSIGSEISRQCLELGAAALIAFERHENSLYNLDMEVKTKMKGAPFYPVIGDVNDRYRVEETLRDFEPDIIFHAAAHKHVPMMEANPREAIYNNVLGTRSVAFLAGQFGVGTFVLISTDKAVNPTSVMGASKRACELIVKALSEGSQTRYITVRFGNVLGSSGSVVPLFREQINRGGPITVTHPDIERFLMLIPEAVQLVLEAASMGDGGETYVLDMGEPMKIADMARHMIVLSGYEPDKDIKIVYTGLRPGEKLYEELFDSSEDVSPTSAPKIMRAVPRELPDREAILSLGQMLEQCVFMKDTEGMLRVLSQVVDNYTYTAINEYQRRVA